VSALPTPEDELLVLVARIGLDAGDAARLDALLSGDLDWGAVEARAEALGLEALLFRHLSDGERAARVPSATVARLRDAYDRQAIRGVRTLGKVGRILDALRAADVPVVLLKGAFLLGSLYPDAALRPMNDVDLLCRPADADRVREVLEGLGYRQKAKAEKSATHKLIAAERCNHLPGFVDDRGTAVEVHLQLFAGLANAEENLAAVWEAAVPCDWNGTTVLALSPEDQLAYLLIHLHGHAATTDALTLYWWCDIHEVIRSAPPSFAWERLLARLASLGRGAEAGTLLALLREHWRTPVADDVLKRLGGDASSISLPSLLEGGCANPRLLVGSRVALVERLAATEGRLAAARYLFRVAWPSRQFVAEHFRVDPSALTLRHRLRFACGLSRKWARTAASGVSRAAPRNATRQQRPRDASRRDAPPSGVAVECSGVTVSFGSRVILREIDLQLEAGTITALVGRCGAGKTTLLKALAGLVPAAAGTIRVRGRRLPEESLPARREIGFASAEERSFYWRLSGRENLRFFAALHGLRGPGRDRAIEEAISAVGLEGEAGLRFQEYSSGMRQALGVARALLHEPSVLLLDEPTRSLSPDMVKRVRGVLERQAGERGTAVLIASHHLREVERIAGQVVLMDRGRVIASGSLAQLKERAGMDASADLDALFEHFTGA
jgi:ABC-2 type transport system ATP-binding protein